MTTAESIQSVNTRYRLGHDQSFYIGGYQSAAKRLKGRNGQILDFEGILHYQRIIKVLAEMERLIEAFDKSKIQ